MVLYGNRRKILCTLIMILICAFAAIYITTKLFFPNELNIIVGKENTLDFSWPMRANIEPDSVPVLSVNHKPVTENINVDLSKPVSLEAKETGKLNVKLMLFGIVPVKDVTVSVIPDTHLIPSGMAVGVKITTKGIMVLGTGTVRQESGKDADPSKSVLHSGDLILQVDGQDLRTKEQLMRLVENGEGKPMSFTIDRDGNEVVETITPKKSAVDDKYRIGVWVRDSTGGIGTMTYVDPVNRTFGALGHGILDVDTRQLMSIKEGRILESELTSVRKGKKGEPGELIGNIYDKRILGQVTANSRVGIYGAIKDGTELPIDELTSLPVGLKQDVKTGPAKIYCTVDGNKIESFDVNIESVNKYTNDEAKGMILKITDERLLEKTGGIVQGMSGSPIIQADKIVGAVTHVFVQDPSKGYGIFIENMLKQGSK